MEKEPSLNEMEKLREILLNHIGSASEKVKDRINGVILPNLESVNNKGNNLKEALQDIIASLPYREDNFDTNGLYNSGKRGYEGWTKGEVQFLNDALNNCYEDLY